MKKPAPNASPELQAALERHIRWQKLRDGTGPDGRAISSAAASLPEVDFTGAITDGADFREADLTGAKR